MLTRMMRWLAGFGDPHPGDGFIPDRVTWVTYWHMHDDPGRRLDRINADETIDGVGWTIARYEPEIPVAPRRPVTVVRVTLTRPDAAYRWRDTGFKGY